MDIRNITENALSRWWKIYNQRKYIGAVEVQREGDSRFQEKGEGGIDIW